MTTSSAMTNRGTITANAIIQASVNTTHASGNEMPTTTYYIAHCAINQSVYYAQGSTTEYSKQNENKMKTT